MVRSFLGIAGEEKGFPARGEMAMMPRESGEKFGRGEVRKYRL